MKVFLSWSGERSHKVALAFRDWLPSVIQSIEPYVSSEDIDKGARWSTDIAKELEDSTYGILCVTQENMNAPWLTFEAGALSKTMDKSYVSPFLFDVKRSEVHGPILQFQSTIFEKEDIKKLLVGLNKASDQETLTDDRLNKAFEVWFPTLEEELNKLRTIKCNDEDKKKDIVIENPSGAILEEILDLSRVNQKLLRNPESVSRSEFDKLQTSIEEIKERLRRPVMGGPRRKRFDPILFEEMIHGSSRYYKSYVGFLMILSLFREDYPWIYEAGVDAVRELRINGMKSGSHDVIMQFEQILELTFESPIMRDMTPYNKDLKMYGRKLHFMLRESFDRNS